jgi:hypothetical protein
MQTLNVLAIVKENEQYLFIYDDDSEQETIRTFSRFAADEELSFTWMDCAVLSQKLLKLKKERDDCC